MRRSSSHYRAVAANAAATKYDVDEEGLFLACRDHFADPQYEVLQDERRTVWVKRTDGTCSIGLQPWLLGQHPLDDVLARAEAKLGGATAAR
jgi:hypothetical protein